MGWQHKPGCEDREGNSFDGGESDTILCLRVIATMPVGLIGGTGLSELEGVELEAEVVATRFGEVAVRRGRWAGREVVFLGRHGADQNLAPHQIPYQANIAALDKLGCTHIIATNAVGAIRQDIEPGHFALPNQFIDFTKTRPLTLFDDTGSETVYVDVTEPYSPQLRDLIAEQAWELNLVIHQDIVYVCTEGPRFETPAEIQMFATLGGDVVGMTGVPEVVLACEAQIPYASICIATNYAAGLSAQPLTDQEVHELMDQCRPDLLRLLEAVLSQLKPQPPT